MKIFGITVALFFLLASVFTSAAAIHSSLAVQAGDTVYVCPCASDCGCRMVSLKEGKCGCGHQLAKVVLTKVKGQKGYYQLDGKKQSAALAGNFVCACSTDCCRTISQKAAKCGCGKDMLAVVMPAQAGDTLFVCPCSSSCACGMVAKKEAKCGCGHQLVSVTLTKVKGQKAYYKLSGKTQTANLAGKFVCACGPECCQAVSQKAVKCGCGKEMTEVVL
jgi:hypothetical protein